MPLNVAVSPKTIAVLEIVDGGAVVVSPNGLADAIAGRKELTMGIGGWCRGGTSESILWRSIGRCRMTADAVSVMSSLQLPLLALLLLLDMPFLDCFKSVHGVSLPIISYQR